jgi:hypothetical protein
MWLIYKLLQRSAYIPFYISTYSPLQPIKPYGKGFYHLDLF